ncbi:MAG: hypothetical protein HYZ53_11935 [Planctomycetes bacterium]|nr:hypothetical protein [Planctomycetota bacterium]
MPKMDEPRGRSRRSPRGRRSLLPWLAVAALVAFLPARGRAQDGGATAATPAPATAQPAASNGGLYTLGDLARDLSHEPGAFEAALERLGGGTTAVGSLSPEAREKIRALAASGDYRALDRQPRLTLEELGVAIRGMGARRGPSPETPLPAPGTRVIENLGIPTHAVPPTGEPYLKEMGYGLAHGDRIDPERAARFGDSERLATVLDRLSMNRPGEPAAFSVRYRGENFRTPEGLIRAFQRHGHTVTIQDERMAANFGDLWKDGKPVATPLWVRTGRKVGDGTDDELVLPVPHAHLAVKVRGPEVNADTTLYNGLDLAGTGGGGTRFRADLTSDQPWVGGRVANTYEGKDAVKAMRLMGQLRRTTDEKVRANHLPLDGYHALGVCTLTPAILEKALRGRTTLWPLTQDPSLFQGDGEIDRIVRSLPVDGRGGPPATDDRLLGALPWSDRASIPFGEVGSALDRLGVGGDGPLQPPAKGFMDRLPGQVPEPHK